MINENNELIALGARLTELAVKGTVTTVAKKIKTMKDVKEAEKLRNTYDEIINELLNEREESIRIAQAYKDELDKVVISDRDIEHLHNTVDRLLEMMKNSSVITSNEKQISALNQCKELINVDTLKTMQLLGFNYKEAIGEPLTMMLRNLLLSKVVEPDSLKPLERLITPEMVQILKDDQAYENFCRLTGRSVDAKKLDAPMTVSMEKTTD